MKWGLGWPDLAICGATVGFGALLRLCWSAYLDPSLAPALVGTFTLCH